MSSAGQPRSLTGLLDALDAAATGPSVSVADVLTHVGERSFTPVILAVALLLVSPASGIPGVPTLSAFLIVLVGVQGLARRRHLWLPGVLMRRQIGSERFRSAIGWLRRPAGWIDRHSHARLRGLTWGPARLVAFTLCVVIPMMWPALELVPFVTSIGAGAVALIAFGLLTRDGLYVLLGYVMCGAGVAAVMALV
ncbi:exopolysaccharide biosynthesis protein [Antarcticimicrobium sediminis]|uniref:Exopolysaccharide biosynthesis protein n=1 Tax=Antarcticimicrobium sediminis TaxID=2546227 RepID=A0A4R5EQJ8_9RHOB|nr:exopolysaccharide biosynthesis protein [Antarcticimicrobium sediminis]TDE37095.1 exopolysaccharide biosynthesis protein [Antarcticimicrobium sediminis]